MSVILDQPLTADKSFPGQTRRLRLGIVGGGRIAATQAMAVRLTDRFEIVAGALSSDPERARQKGRDWHLDPARCYASFAEMAEAEGRGGWRGGGDDHHPKPPSFSGRQKLCRGWHPYYV